MVDSTRIFDPGWRALNANGDPFTDAVISFFNAGTDDERTVYSDSDLSTSLGTEVDCNAGGEPVTSVNNPTLIYTGTTAYKVTISSAIAGYSRTFDDVLGALDTSDFLTEAAVADRSVVPVSTNRSVTTADKGKILDINCSGGDITLTFDDAATLGDGFFVGLRHNGTANQVKITSDGSDTFGIPGANVTGFSLTGRGQGCTVTCDATNFKTDAWTPPLISGNTGVILIADRLSTPAGSPEAGQRYIVRSSPTGAWSGFAEHDIAEASGFGTWFNYTPATDCGWLAYVQDENTFYGFFDSAWATTVSGLTEDTDPDSINDFMEIFDASASSNKKIPLYLTPGAIIAIIEDQKAQNTNGQTLTAGADRTRDLTTLAYNRDSLVSLDSNQFTLPAGTWEIDWHVQEQNDANDAVHQSLLYNVTDAAEVARGTSAFGNGGGTDPRGQSTTSGSAVVTIADAKAFEIRHRGSTTMLGGLAANFGTEVYARVIVRRA